MAKVCWKRGCSHASLSPKWLWAATFIVFASHGRFLGVVLSSLGFSDTEVGLIMSSGMFPSLLTISFFTKRADDVRIGCTPVLRLLTLANALSFSLLGLVPWVTPSHTARFWLALAARAVSTMCFAPILPITDAYTLRILGNNQSYGRERYMGAVVWSLTNLALGYMMDVTQNPLWVSLCTLWMGTGLVMGVLCVSPREIHSKQPSGDSIRWKSQDGMDMDRTATKQSSLWWLWFTNLVTATFLTARFVQSAASYAVDNLMLLFLRNQLEASYLICGLSVMITSVFEIPLFFFSKPLLARFGAVKLLAFGMCSYIVRVVAYTVIANPWYVLIVEPLHGITFASVYTATVAFVYDHCPKDRISEGQGIRSLMSTVAGVSATTGGSRVLDVYGAKILYRGFAGLCGLTLVVYTIVFAMCVESKDSSIHAEEEEGLKEEQHE